MTLADLKRDADSRKIRLELIERFGKCGDDIPSRLRGIRNISKTNTVGMYLTTAEGSESLLHYPAAGLVEYDGKTLTIYRAGEREFTDKEKRIEDECRRRRDEYYKKYPWGEFYWQSVAYYKNSDAPWLSGSKTIRGKYRTYNNQHENGYGTIVDNRIRGKAILKYRIYRED